MRWITVLLLGGGAAMAGCGSDSTSGTGGTPSAGGPTITMVAWATTPTCAQFEETEYTVTITATDPDDSPAALTYNGSVNGCAGDIDGAVSTIVCPNVSPYPGTVMVTDPDANESAPVTFDIGVCESDSCATPPNAC